MIDSDNKPVENTLDYLVPCKQNDVHWFVRRDRVSKVIYLLLMAHNSISAFLH